MSEHYDGAGDGQCLAIKASDGERCTNGVYGSNEFCGHHKRASDVTTAIEVSDAEWVRCDECGWQKAEWDGPDPPCCSWCGVRVSRRNYEIREGGESA
jgi:hypothetical protein